VFSGPSLSRSRPRAAPHTAAAVRAHTRPGAGISAIYRAYHTVLVLTIASAHSEAHTSSRTCPRYNGTPQSTLFHLHICTTYRTHSTTVERKTTLRIECLRMPGCNLLGPINVYERPAAAVTVMVKCLRMHDSKGCKNSHIVPTWLPLRLRCLHNKPLNAGRGHLAAMH
jgi:hypothetical protein